MYGRKKYGRPDLPPVEVPTQDTSVSTFVCPRCNKIKNTKMQHIEITALENGKLFLYTKMCDLCAKALLEWMNK